MIGDPGFDMRVSFSELLVTLQGGFAECGTHPLHGRNEGALQQDAEVFIQLRDLLIQQFQILFRYLQNLRVLQAVYIVAGWDTGKEAVQVPNPPVFRAKEKDMFLTFGIDLIGSGKSLDHKGLLVCYIPFLEDVLVLPEFSMPEHRLEYFQFCLVKNNIPGSKILNK